MFDQAEKLRELARSKRSTVEIAQTESVAISAVVTNCRSIAVTSGKGGVGKTNIALSLSLTLASFNKKVLLLDADLGLANVHILLGIAPVKNISHFIDGTCDLKSIIYNVKGIDILPGASGLEKLANMDLGRLEYLTHEFSTLEQNYDFIVIDTGAGIGSLVTRFASKADLTLLVMTPEPTSLADAYAMVKVLYEKGTKKIAAVVNMASSDKDGTETFDRLNALVVKFLKRPLEHVGIIPFNREVSLFVRKQKVLVLEKTADPFSIRIQAIARRISGIPAVKKAAFFSRFWSVT